LREVRKKLYERWIISLSVHLWQHLSQHEKRFIISSRSAKCEKVRQQECLQMTIV
jgi:hypothetical protein